MTFERVNSFVYLGTLITADNNASAEINNRIALANRSYFGLVNIHSFSILSYDSSITTAKAVLH